MSGDQEQRVEGERFRSLRAPEPVHFPVEETVPETKRHLELRTLLYQVLKLAFADRAAVGCDQFVYWDPTDPRACLAPDAFVRLGHADHLFRSWKVWEHGAPQVCVEVISDADERDRDWAAKLEKYRQLGVTELVRFDPEASERPLRIWNAAPLGLVEREGVTVSAHSACLPGYWVVLEHAEFGLWLRLSHDERGEHLYPTPTEHEAAAHRVDAEALRAAERRVLELEEALRRLS